MSDLIDSQLAGQFDRLPPQSIDAEKCLLASMMIDKEAIGNVAVMIDRDAFYQTDHQIIFDILLKLNADNRPADAVLVRDELNKKQLLEEVGGANYIAQLLNTVPSAAHAMHYAGIVREKFLLRQLIASSNETLRDAYAPHEKADIVVDRAERRIYEIAEKRIGSTPAVKLESILHEVYESLEDRGQRGLETDFLEFDDLLNGLQNGEMIIVAGRPSIGKTSFAMNIIENVAANHKLPCAVFSLEMSKQQLAQRMLCSRANVDAQKVRRGMTSAEEFRRLASTVVEFAKCPIWVDDAPGLTILELRAKARRLKRQHDIKLLVVDYLQLMDAPDVEDGRQQQITQISRGIKSVARELNIPIIAVSQLNRMSESREGHRPRMSDLRESGSIEQDADVVVLLHREDYYKMTEADFTPDHIAEAIVAKNRNGPTGTVKLTFDNRTTTFRNLAAQVDPDMFR